MVSQAGTDSLDVRVCNLGGIEDLAATVEPGVTVLVGRNATNRTSLLRSLTAALGGSTGKLRGSADQGRVELELEGETYVREFHREADGRVRVDGEPYTDDATVVDLFAALVESNPVRRAVERADGDELRELLVAPVDTEALAAEIDATRGELRNVEDRLDEIDRRLGNLPALERRREETAEELADVEADLADAREAVDSFEVDAEDAADGAELVEELQSVREEYGRVRDDRDAQVEAVESLESDLESVEEELSEIDVPAADVADAEAELERLRRRERELSTSVSNLLSIVEFNEELLEGSEPVPTADEDRTPVDQLDPASRTLECWTCGTSVERRQIDERLDALRDVVEEKREERAAAEAAIDDQRTALEELREHGDRRDELQERRSAIESEIDRRQERLASLEDRASSLRARIDELEAETRDVEDRRTADLLEQSQRLSELEYERGQLEETIDRLDDEIAAAEERAAERDRLEDRRDGLESELAALRDRVDELETSVVDTFNDHVETVLGRLDYENVERVWLERRYEAEPNGATPDSDIDDDATFDVHVVRAADDGSVYEDTIEHLSESEREVIGLVVALAGYLVHEVHETVPVMTLDSLEAIDADRIAALLEYLAEYTPYLVVALLPGDARAVSETYDRIEMGRD